MLDPNENQLHTKPVLTDAQRALTKDEAEALLADKLSKSEEEMNPALIGELPELNRAQFRQRLDRVIVGLRKADGTPDVRVELEDLTSRKRRKGDLPWLMHR